MHYTATAMQNCCIARSKNGIALITLQAICTVQEDQPFQDHWTSRIVRIGHKECFASIT
jgi:hypothetical protein